MNRSLLTIFLPVFLSGCLVGNPWEQFLSNIQMFVGQDFTKLKQSLEQGGRHEITKQGYRLPNGNLQHEFFWGYHKPEKCILLIEINPSTNKVITVGGKGATTECQWGG